jgi:hypothetical protein
VFRRFRRTIESDDGKSLDMRNGSVGIDLISLVQRDDSRVESKVIARHLGLSTIVQEIFSMASNLKPESSGV